jgi:hypothetical protein
LRKVGWVERQVRRADRFQQRHALLATILGFALSGDPALRERLIDSALGNIPVIGDQLRSQVHPLGGNTVALVIGGRRRSPRRPPVSLSAPP